MFLDQFNLNQLRVFESVFRNRSMTLASQELHLTQSGVSQHIKSLEEALGVPLFDRINQRLIPTAQSGALFEECQKSLSAIEASLSSLKSGGKELSGTVSLGIPIEFGNNLVLPALAGFSKKHPEVRFRIELGFASGMNERILRGDMDFAFVDEFTLDRRIVAEKIYDEILELCIAEDLLKSLGTPKNDRKFYESLRYIEYEDGEPVLRMWFGHHLRDRNLRLRIRATAMDVQGIARMISEGMGAGVIPHHLYLRLQKEGRKLTRFRGSGKPLKNMISMAYLQDRTHSPAALAAMKWLKQELTKRSAGGPNPSATVMEPHPILQ